MSGTPSKMLEHLLDTRLNSPMGPNEDPFLDDFLLTHIVFMSTGQLVDELVNHYHNENDYRNGAEHSADDYEYLLISKKRVVQFIQRWVTVVRHVVFDEPAAAHFIAVSVFSIHTSYCTRPVQNTQHTFDCGNVTSTPICLLECQRLAFLISHENLQRWRKLKNLKCHIFISKPTQEIAQDMELDHGLQEEVGIIHHVLTQMSRYQEDCQQSMGQKWKLPPNGQPISLFSGKVDGSRSIIRSDDDSKLTVIPQYTIKRADEGKLCNEIFFSVFSLPSNISCLLCGSYFLHAAISHLHHR